MASKEVGTLRVSDGFPNRACGCNDGGYHCRFTRHISCLRGKKGHVGKVIERRSQNISMLACDVIGAHRDQL
eukprot:6462816-Amphidinium_carterae.1